MTLFSEETERQALAIVSSLQPSVICDEEGLPNRLVALEVAHNMTDEDAQALYHFAVLVTKLVRT